MAHSDDYIKDVNKHPQDKALRCSAQTFKDFERNSAWLDMVDLINDRIDILRTELEASDSMEDIRFLQGQVTELRAMSVYPQYLQERAEEEKANNN